MVLTWDDPGDDTITGYVILRRNRQTTVSGQFSELVADTGSAATTYTDDTVAAETTYTYRIKAINEHGVSERSRWFHIDIPPAPEAVEGDDQDEQGGEDGGGAPGHATPPGPGGRANVSEGGTDLPANTSTTGEVDVGGSVTGDIGSGGDSDWFKVELEAGTRYQIDVEGADTGRGTGPDPSVFSMVDADGTRINGTLDSHGGVGKNARLIYTPTSDGTYFVWVSGNEATTGTYTLSVIVLGANGASEADTDFPETTATTGRVEVGASATGNSGASNDVDWFKVELEAGKTYQIDQKGEDSGVGTLEDPYLLNIRDSSGNAISGTENDDVEPDNDIYESQITFTPTAAGVYYLVAASNGATGTYTLSVREIACTLNTGNIWCGVVTVGELRPSPAALVGHGFADSTSLSAGGLAGNPDDTMFSVGDNDYTISGAYIQVPTADHLTGTLFVVLDKDLSDDDKAGLVLTVDDTTTTFAFSDASKGGTTGLYSWGQSSLDWSSTTTVTVRLSGPPPDDFPDGTNTTGQVDVGGSVTGNIESADDADWFLVELEAGTRYQIDLEGADTGRGTLVDSAIAFLLNEIGDTISDSGGSDSGVGKNDRTIYTPSMSGAYYVDVSSGTTATGTYTVSVIVLGANGASEADTYFLNSTATTGRVEIGASATGNIATGEDTDWFRVDLTAGRQYQFDMEGMDTGRGTYTDPFMQLFDAPGTFILAEDRDGGEEKNARLTYTPATSGLYFIVASRGLAALSGTGTYTLSVREIPPPCTLNTGDIWCGVVTVGDLKTSADVLVSHGFADTSSLSAGGLVGNPGDTMFSVGDNDYTIRGLYVGAPGGNNDGSLFFLLTADLSDDDKENLVLKIDGVTTDRALSDASRLSAGLYSWANTGLDWSSETTVTVRLQGPTTPDDSADPPEADSGNVSEGDGEDLPADTTTTTTGKVEVGGSVTGNIASASDRDWFRVDLKKDKRYQIDLEGADTNRGTLTDPLLNAMRDASDNSISGTANDDSGVGINARTIFTAPEDGTHYVVAAANGATGTYTLSVILLGTNGASEADLDFPVTTAATGRVEVGASATDNIDPGDDLDGFRVYLEAGKRYRFDLEGADTGRGTLEDPALTLYGDSFDASHHISEDDDGGEGLNSRLTYTATATGTYHLQVESFSDPGTYTLSVRRILVPVAVPPGGLGPSEIPGAVRNVEVSYSGIGGIGQIVCGGTRRTRPKPARNGSRSSTSTAQPSLYSSGQRLSLSSRARALGKHHRRWNGEEGVGFQLLQVPRRL